MARLIRWLVVERIVLCGHQSFVAGHEPIDFFLLFRKLLADFISSRGFREELLLFLASLSGEEGHPLPTAGQCRCAFSVPDECSRLVFASLSFSLKLNARKETGDRQRQNQQRS